ncbi:hypothetical protein K6V90_09525 [Cupriavidus pauculus]|uniref:DUF7666 domain-containing protein n=1 Tax=Cupriavidus pauculus TaxID=82633 RepID=UPI001C936DAC|nr:hypothetical protein [Cupriavidus pauculus]MBY4730771.1 hypothetical protein [Cupriavidus pauculus]
MQKQEKQEKQGVIVAYKAFNKDLTCRDFQFEIGKTYEHDGKVIACESGFHACENPMDTWGYYDLTQSRFCTVELSGELCRHGEDSKVAAGRITLRAEIGLPQIITDAVKWMLAFVKDMPAAENASGDSSNLAASGDSSKLAASGDSSNLAASGDSSNLAASGDSSKLAASGYSSKLAASGDSSKLAASGDSSKLAASGNSSKLAASGYSSKLAASGNSSKLAASGNSSKLAASGYYSKLAASGDSSKLAASGKKSIAVASGLNCKASAGEDGCIALAWWDDDAKRFRLEVAYIGENGIEPNVMYELDEDHKFSKVEDES